MELRLILAWYIAWYPLMMYLCISVIFARKFFVIALHSLNPFTHFYRGKLRSIPEGLFVPKTRSCCKIFSYMLWVSILCELIVVGRFLHGKYPDYKQLSMHYLFDKSTSALDSWPDDLTLTYNSNADGTGLLKLSKELPYELKLPTSITQNMDDLAFAIDVRYNYHFNTEKAVKGVQLIPVVRFETQKQHSERQDDSIELLTVIVDQKYKDGMIRSNVIMGDALEFQVEDAMNPVWSFVQTMCQQRGNEYICTKAEFRKRSRVMMNQVSDVRTVMFGSFVLIWLTTFWFTFVSTVLLIFVVAMFEKHSCLTFLANVLRANNLNMQRELPSLIDFFHIVGIASTPCSILWAACGPRMFKMLRDKYSLGEPGVLLNDCVLLFLFIQFGALYQAIGKYTDVQFEPNNPPHDLAPHAYIAHPALARRGMDDGQVRVWVPGPVQPPVVQPPVVQVQPPVVVQPPVQPEVAPAAAPTPSAPAAAPTPPVPPVPPITVTPPATAMASSNIPSTPLVTPPRTLFAIPNSMEQTLSPSVPSPEPRRRHRLRTDSSPLLKLSKAMRYNEEKEDGDVERHVGERHVGERMFADPFVGMQQAQSWMLSQAKVELQWSLWYAQHNKTLLQISLGEERASSTTKATIKSKHHT